MKKKPKGTGASPKSIGMLADAMYALKQRIQAAELKKSLMEKELRKLEEKALPLMTKHGVARVVGASGGIKVKEETCYNIEDWTALCSYVKKKGAWDLMYRRVNSRAVAARLEEKEKVAGVTSFSVRRVVVLPKQSVLKEK